MNRFINPNRKPYNQYILPMRNMLIYSWSIQFQGVAESVSFLVLMQTQFSNIIIINKKTLLGSLHWLWEDWWIWRMRQRLVAQLVHVLRHWLCGLPLSTVLILSVHAAGCRQWAFSHLTDLLSTLLRYKSVSRIQKDTVDKIAPDHKALTYFSACLAF